MIMKRTSFPLLLTITVSLMFSVTVQADPLTKEQCLGCHGPTFDDLINKNVQTQSDSGPINPHTWIPHAGGDDKNAIECTECHAQHPMPPASGYKDKSVGLEPCYACHHNYQFKKCGECHK